MIENVKDTEQLLLLLSLSQVQDAGTVRRIFAESMAEMFPGHGFSIVDADEAETGEDALEVPVATIRRRFGMLRVTPGFDEPARLSAVRNLTAMLGVLLENLAQRDELRRRAEQTEALLSNIVRKLPVLVYVFDPDRGETVYQNVADPGDRDPQSLTWAVDGPPHLTGRFDPEARDAVACHLQRLSAAQPGEVVSLEFRTLDESEDHRWLLSHDTLYAAEPDRPHCILGACVDITAARKQAEDLRETVTQRDLLLNEVHHRVKNNMQIIVSLLNLQQDVLPDHRGADVFVQVRNRVTAMALVHEQLYHSTTLSAIDVRPYLGNLVSIVRQSYESPDSRWRIAVSCDDLRLGLDESIPFGLLVTELVSNALQHAGGAAPKLTVSVRATEERMVELEVGDNGPGISDETLAHRTGMGLTLVDGLVQQLDGVITHDGESGTRWRIRFARTGDERPG